MKNNSRLGSLRDSVASLQFASFFLPQYIIYKQMFSPTFSNALCLPLLGTMLQFIFQIWDKFTDALKNAFIITQRISNTLFLFELVLAGLPPFLVSEARQATILKSQSHWWYSQRKYCLANFMHTDDKQLFQAQTQYKRLLDARLRQLHSNVVPDNPVLSNIYLPSTRTS